ncbi:MAG TPA: adenylate/guanylate cyclase domain-containing protein [Acidimicrobiales bacterium]
MRPQSIEEGREAFDRCDWPAVVAALTGAEADGAELDADNLERLALAATWVGDWELCIGSRERAFALYSAAGNQRRAAGLAVELCTDQVARQRQAVALGWFERANQLLDGSAPCSELACLEDLRALANAFVFGDLETGAVHAQAAVALGVQLGDRDIEAVARCHLAQIRIRQGDLKAGMKLLDQAMTAAVSGELGPTATARVYCNTISMCQALGDLRRAREWTEEAIRCSSRPGLSDWPGDCQLHRAELTRMGGDWNTAESEIHHILPELERWDPGHAALAWQEIGEIRRRRGDLDGAWEAFTRAQGLGRDPQPGLALLLLAKGNVVAADTAITAALTAANGSDPLLSAQLLPAAVAIHLARDDLEAADAAALRLEGLAERFPTIVLRAAAAAAVAEVALARNDPEVATSAARQAVAFWRDAGAPHETAVAQVLVARASRALGDPAVARVELEAANSSFVALGADPDVAAATALLAELSGVIDRGERVRRTFVFTDIVDSTRLVAAMGDEQWSAVLAWHNKSVRELLAAHGGEEVKQRGGGDGFFTTFSQPAAAVACAVDIQRTFAIHRQQNGFAPSIRIGLHEADATLADRDYSGRGVHEAARVTELAGAGDIVASTATVISAGWSQTSTPNMAELRGLPDPIEVVHVIWT